MPRSIVRSFPIALLLDETASFISYENGTKVNAKQKCGEGERVVAYTGKSGVWSRATFHAPLTVFVNVKTIVEENCFTHHLARSPARSLANVSLLSFVATSLRKFVAKVRPIPTEVRNLMDHGEESQLRLIANTGERLETRDGDLELIVWNLCST